MRGKLFLLGIMIILFLYCCITNAAFIRVYNNSRYDVEIAIIPKKGLGCGVKRVIIPKGQTHPPGNNDVWYLGCWCWDKPMENWGSCDIRAIQVISPVYSVKIRHWNDKYNGRWTDLVILREGNAGWVYGRRDGNNYAGLIEIVNK